MESEDDYLQALKDALDDMESHVSAVDAVTARWDEVAEVAKADG